MSFKHITSRDNAIFKAMRKLAENARERQKTGQTLLDGVHLIQMYHEVFGEPELLIIPEGKSTAEATHLMQQFADVDTLMFPTLMFAELSPVATATGILALVNIPELAMPENPQCVLMLEDIQDPGNLGSMLRTASAAGVDVVYLSTGCTDAWSPKCLRGGQGAQFLLPVLEKADLLAEISQFNGQTFAATMTGESIYQQQFSQATAFVIGNEGNGLRAATIAACSKAVTIPMPGTQQGKMESLNAGVAAAILLFERVRQVAFHAV
jgi:TrmH family RNA methyltransferase